MANRKDAKGRVLKTGESQRPNGTYEYKYKDPQGKRRSVYAKSLKDLRLKEKQIEKDIDQGMNFDYREITVGQLVNQWFDNKKGIRDSTKIGYATKIRQLKELPIFNCLVKNVKPLDIKNLIYELAEEHADSTVREYFGILKKAGNYGLENDFIVRNPFAIPIHPLLNGKTKPKESFTDEEFDRLIEYMRGNLYSYYVPHFILLRETGLRISEFCGISLDDIDFDRRLLKVNKQVGFLDDCPDKFITELKTQNSNAYIPLTQTAIDALHEIINLHPKGVSLKSRDEATEYDHLIIVSKHGKPMNRQSWASICFKLTKRYNKEHPDTPIHIYAHKFRHTTATRLLKNGISVPATQRMLRHSDPKTTLKFYTHFNVEDVQHELDEVFGEGDD